MPPVVYPDYAPTRLERFWASDEPVFQVGTQPVSSDGMIVLPGASVPMVAPEMVPSEERNPTPGVRETFIRKKQPSEFDLPFYLRMPTVAGTRPTWGLLAKKGFGRELLGTYAKAQTAAVDPNANVAFVATLPGVAGNSITVTLVVAGNSTPLTVAVVGTVITVNVATDSGGVGITTARQVINALRADDAAAMLVMAQLVGNGLGLAVAGSVTLTGGADVGGISYAPATFIEESSFSLHHWMGNELRHIRGCLINEITVLLSGASEGRINFMGLGTNESFAGVGLLAGALTNVATVAFLANPQRFLAFGLETGDCVRVKIEDEIALLVKALKSETTGEVELTRGLEGSTAAAHAAGAQIGPYEVPEGPLPDEVIASGCLGSVYFDGILHRVIDFEVTLNNGLEAREDEYGLCEATGYRRGGPRTVTGTFRAYALKAQKGLDSALEMNREYTVFATAGEQTTALCTLYMPRVKLNTVEPAGDGPEFIKTYTFTALERIGNDELFISLT